jgi:uncharacterized protein (DUF427 family)
MPNIILEQAGTPDHPITVERAPGPITLSVSGQSIADATNALILREGRYPPTKVTHCPYKGEATHWKATLADGRTIDPIAWSYENPIQGITSIQGYLGFYTHAFDGAFDPPPR